MADPFDVFKDAGIGDKEYYSSVVDTTLPPVPKREDLLKMSETEINSLREKYHGNSEAQTALAPVQHFKMNKSVIAEGGLLQSLITVPSMVAATAVYADFKERGILPSDVDTGKDPATEAVYGLKGIGAGLKELLYPEEDKKVETKQPTEQEILKKQVEDILPSLIQTESGGRHTTKDGKILTGVTGDKGITQIRPATGQDPGYGIKPIQNETQEEYIRFTKDYLSKMIQIFGSVEHGVAAYNAGPGSIHRAVSKAKRTGKDWKEFIPKTTKEYLKKVSIDNETVA
ncbi:MAG: lytic transglycosylase domain-containing protein [Candidatus Woesearchaeota archaeon]|jgi:hypothetical protein